MVDLSSFQEALRRDGTLTLHLKVIPKASKSEIVAFQSDGTLKAKLAAAPEKGKANQALRELLATAFGVGTSAVEIISGETARLKRVRIRV